MKLIRIDRKENIYKFIFDTGLKKPVDVTITIIDGEFVKNKTIICDGKFTFEIDKINRQQELTLELSIKDRILFTMDLYVPTGKSWKESSFEFEKEKNDDKKETITKKEEVEDIKQDNDVSIEEKNNDNIIANELYSNAEDLYKMVEEIRSKL